jgi:hypothetical protein
MSNIDGEERGVIFALMVNVTRTIVYILFSLAYLQIYWEGIDISANSLDFLVPGYLAVIDICLIIVCFVNRRRFWNLVPLVSFLAMAISISSVMRLWGSGPGVTFLGDFMMILALFVLVISIAELTIWAAKEAEIMRSLDTPTEKPVGEYRTYKY